MIYKVIIYKAGKLKFIRSSHVQDLMYILRLLLLDTPHQSVSIHATSSYVVVVCLVDGSSCMAAGGCDNSSTVPFRVYFLLQLSVQLPLLNKHSNKAAAPCIPPTIVPKASTLDAPG